MTWIVVLPAVFQIASQRIDRDININVTISVYVPAERFEITFFWKKKQHYTLAWRYEFYVIVASLTISLTRSLR